MTELNFPISRYGSFLATRSLGRGVRVDLEDQLSSAQNEVGVVLDFHGVEAITISFADECVARFLASHAQTASAAFVVITGLNEETSEAVGVSLERREIGAAILGSDGLTWQPGPPHLRETYACALRLQSFRAAELAGELNLSMSNANNRLKRLAAGGALTRVRSPGPEHGGKEFLYRCPAIRARTAS